MPDNQSREYTRRKVLQATTGAGALAGFVPKAMAQKPPSTATIVTHKQGDDPLKKRRSHDAGKGSSTPRRTLEKPLRNGIVTRRK